jgi:hypothetical protein
MLPDSRHQSLKKLLQLSNRKPLRKRIQVFTPWNSPYIGLQFNSRFLGIQVRRGEEI